MKHFKIVLLGSALVGKSSLAKQFVLKLFDGSNEPTLEECFQKVFFVDGESCQMQLTDTAACNNFSAMQDLYIKENDGFILVYSITDSNSFEDIKTIGARIVQARYSEQVPIVLVGNKRDLEDSKRVIKTSEGSELAAKWPFCEFMETTAKDHSEIECLFTSLARQIIKFQTMKVEATVKQKSGPCSVM